MLCYDSNICFGPNQILTCIHDLFGYPQLVYKGLLSLKMYMYVICDDFQFIVQTYFNNSITIYYVGDTLNILNCLHITTQ